MRWIPIVALALAGCATATTTRINDGAGTYYVREGMVNAINYPTERMWNLQVEVMDDYGNFDPVLMTAEHWQTMEDAARLLEADALFMAEADAYVAADPDGNLLDAPEGTDLAAIQARLDTNPDAFRAYARTLATHAMQLGDAIEARDTGEVTRLVNDLQPVCKACHDAFWYPEEYQAQ